MRELTEDIGGLILSTIEDLPDVETLPNLVVEKDDLTIRNRMFKTPELRKIHIEEAEIGGIKILHCVFFPDPHYAIPIFGCDIVSNGKTVTAAIVDVSPVKGFEDWDKIREISNAFEFSDGKKINLSNLPVKKKKNLKFISYSTKIKPEIQKIYDDLGVKENIRMKRRKLLNVGVFRKILNQISHFF